MSGSRAVPAATTLMVLFLGFSFHSSAAPIPTAATQAMLNQNPGVAAMVQEDRVVALYGAPSAVNDGSTLDAFVETFVTNNGDAFGVDNVDLQFKDKITIRNGEMTVYTYYQRIGGIPVEGSIVKIPVIIDQTTLPNPGADIISYAGIRLMEPPNHSLPAGSINAEQAVEIVRTSTDYPNITNLPDPLDPTTPPDEVIFEAPDGTKHRVWRFDGWGTGGSFRFYVDTTTGEIVVAHSLAIEFATTVSGTVKGFSTPCCDRANPPTLGLLPGAEVSIEYGISCPVDPANPVVADETLNASEVAQNSGAYTFSNVDPLPARVTGLLRSRLVDVHDCDSLNTPSDFDQRRAKCLADAQTNLLPRLQVCETVPTGHTPGNTIDLTFNSGANPDFADTAQVNAYLAVHAT